MSLLGRIGGALRGAVGGFVAGGPAGAIGGAALGALGSSGPRRPAVGGMATGLAVALPRTGFVSSSPKCPPGTSGIPPLCVNLPGGQVTGGGAVLTYGEAVTARYGSALVPASREITVRRCPRGAVLGNDGYCYNRASLNKRDRMWIPGRKPLLTGGDLNAITKAHRAANKLKAQQKRLMAMGMLPRPSTRGRGRRGYAQQGPPGTITVVDT